MAIEIESMQINEKKKNWTLIVLLISQKNDLKKKSLSVWTKPQLKRNLYEAFKFSQSSQRGTYELNFYNKHEHNIGAVNISLHVCLDVTSKDQPL